MRLDRNGLEILSRAECLKLLASRPIGRVGLSRDALPAVQPVTYALSGEDVMFATGIGSEHLAPAGDTVIAFEVDDIDSVTRCGWSVLILGVAHRLTPHEVRSAPAAALDLRPWVGSRAVHLMRLRTDHLSGRRLTGELPQAS